ncbi:unnamed protein product [Urochloa humidicola]
MAIGSPSPATIEAASVDAGPEQRMEGNLQEEAAGTQVIRAQPKRKTVKTQTLFSFYKKIEATSVDLQVQGEGEGEGEDDFVSQEQNPQSDENVVQEDEAPRQPSPKIQRLNSGESVLIVERDPGLRCQIWEYPVNEQDEACRIYILHGPYQFRMDDYPLSGSEKHPRRFQADWFNSFPWLEYSPAKDAAFCFPCYLFSKKPSGKVGSDAFTIKGFSSWKKVKEGKNCAFLSHMGNDGNSAHAYNVKCLENLKNQSGHIRHMYKKQYPEDIRKNRLRLKVSIDSVRWLAFQACPFRGHDESASSMNQGNFLEMVKLLAAYDEKVAVEHHYRYDIFTVAVDQQAQELNCRFSEQATELLILCNSLDPKDSFSSLNIDNVCTLASKFYPGDFDEHEINTLRHQLRHYELDVPTNPKFQNLTSVADLCRRLVETNKSDDYYLIHRLIRLVLTLPVSTATTERAFSAMKICKTRLRNKMEDEFLRNCMLLYIEKEIAMKLTTDSIIDDFYAKKKRKVRLK